MKITKKLLIEIIKEELAQLLSESAAPSGPEEGERGYRPKVMQDPMFGDLTAPAKMIHIKNLWDHIEKSKLS